MYDNLFFEEQKDSPRKALITNVAMEGTDITVIFTADNVWRTNIFLTKEKPAGNLPYTKLVGQTEKNMHTFHISEKESYYLTLQTVSNDGVMGQHETVLINLL